MAKDFEALVVAAGHVLKLDDDGDVDSFVLDIGFHNGPGCLVCGDSWCEHCGDPIKPCIGAAAVAVRAAERAAAHEAQIVEELRVKGYTVTPPASVPA